MYHRKRAVSHDIFDIEDIRAEILSRLPLKLLIQCRTINASWRATIDSSSFRKLHVQNQLSENDNNHDEDSSFLELTYFYYFNQSCYELSTMFTDTWRRYCNYSGSYYNFFTANINGGPGGDVEFSRPVHGLICIYKSKSTNPIGLCNPFLQEIKTLPPSQSPHPESPRRFVGFGYDVVRQDYKAVQLSHDFYSKKRSIIVEVYSRKENTWRVLDDNNPFHKDYYIISNIIHYAQPSSRKSEGVVHWQGICKLKKVIVSFDMCSEVWKTIEIPSNERLQIIDIFVKEEDSFIMFDCFRGPLMMWEYNESDGWFRVRSFLHPMPGPGLRNEALFHPDASLWPVATWKHNGFILKVDSGNDEMRNFYEEYAAIACELHRPNHECVIEFPHKIEFYDYRNQKVLKSFKVPRNKLSTLKIVEYRGSFISP